MPKKIRVRTIGPRCLVLPEVPLDEVTARMVAAGLHAVVADKNKPKPTTGIVKGVGNDPLITELVKIGDRVSFAPHAGWKTIIEGVSYLTLEAQEIINVLEEVDEESPPST